MKIKEMLLEPNKYSRPQTKIGTIKNIVVHWVGNAGSTAENNAKYFNSLKDGRGTYASSHYIIGNDGVVIRCVPENEVAYHASNANSYSIGIEVCHPDWNGKFTDLAYKSLVELLVDVCARYKLEPTQAIIRHYDVTGKICPKYYVNSLEAWNILKQDVTEMINKDMPLERAVQILYKNKVIGNQNSWRSINVIQLKYVDILIQKVGQKLFGYGTYEKVIYRFIEDGIILSTSIWLDKTYTKQNVRSLIIKIVEAYM